MKTQRKCNRILFYISTIRGGGAARVMVNLANNFYSRGKEVYLVTNFQENHEYSVDEGVNRISLEEEECKSAPLKKNLSRIRSLRRLIRHYKPDAVVSFMDENNIRLIIASLFLKTKVVISVRNDPKVKYKSIQMKAIVRFVYRIPDTVVFQTEEAKVWFQQSIQEKSAVIQNQVGKQFYSTNKAGEEYYVAVGRLTKQKNIPLLVDGFAELVKLHPKAILRIYGSGELEVELTEYVKDKGCQNSIVFMGQTDCVPEVMSHAKCYILTSDYEGMPNTLLEAMAMGLPIISTDCPCGGPASVIENGKDGLLFPVGSKDELVKLLIRIEESPEFRSQLSSEAKKKAKCFMPELVLKNWYRCICGK